MARSQDRRLARIAANMKSEKANARPARQYPRARRFAVRYTPYGGTPTPPSSAKRIAKNESGVRGRQWVRYRKFARRSSIIGGAR